MATIDIPVGPALEKALQIPPCPDIGLKNPKPLKVMLPVGGSLSSMNDMSRGIPTDCSISFSLLLQLGPFLAALHCPMAILKLIEPLMGFVQNPANPENVKKVMDASKPVMECVAVLTGAGVVPFIMDILRLIRRILGCLVGQLKTIAGLMSGYAIAIGEAEDEGNDDLLETLKCAQKDAMTAAEALNSSIEPVSVILGLLKPFFEIAQMDPIVLPGAGSAADAEALNTVIATLEDVLTAIDAVIGE